MVNCHSVKIQDRGHIADEIPLVGCLLSSLHVIWCAGAEHLDRCHV